MKPNRTPHRPRTALLIGAVLLATPALAQDATVSPPSVVNTVPQAQPAPPPAPVTVTPPPLVPTTVQRIPDTPEEQPRATPAREPTQARRTATRTERRAAAPPPRAAAPVAADPEPVPAPAPVEEPVAQTVPTTPAPAPVEPAAPVETAQTSETVQTSGTALWPWLAGGALLVLAAFAFLLFRRRAEYDDYAEEYAEEPVKAEPFVAAPPVAVQPTPRHEPEVAPRVRAPVDPAELTNPVTNAEEATVVAADAADLAGMTAASAPIAHRPWLELGMRPVRAGTQAEEALVEIELIVGNSGDMAAEDVRISTYMLATGEATSETELELIERAHQNAVPPMTIKAGEGKCVDATLAVSKAELQAHGDTFSPVVVADARYRLPDGTEGRTSASFRIGLSDEDHDGIEPIGLEHRAMYNNVAAELEGAPERV